MEDQHEEGNIRQPVNNNPPALHQPRVPHVPRPLKGYTQSNNNQAFDQTTTNPR